jgi:hypothetical protein
MALDDLPLAVLAPFDVRDPEDVRLHRAAVDGHRGAFIADRVGQVTAHARGDEVEARPGR